MLTIHGNARNILAVSFGADKTWDAVASTTAEQTATLKGLKTTDLIMSVTKPTHQTGLGVTGWRVSAADTIAITFETTASVTPTAGETYTAFIFRPEQTRTDANA